MSCFYVNSYVNVVCSCSPLELCDRVPTNGEVVPLSYPIQPAHGSSLGPPSVGFIPGSGMRPPSGGIPTVLPGSNGLHLGPSAVASSAAMSAAAARLAPSAAA